MGQGLERSGFGLNPVSLRSHDLTTYISAEWSIDMVPKRHTPTHQETAIEFSGPGFQRAVVDLVYVQAVFATFEQILLRCDDLTTGRHQQQGGD